MNIMNTNMIESVPYRISIPDHGTDFEYSYYIVHSSGFRPIGIPKWK